MSNILYAEDDRDCRELFAFALRQAGHTVHEALNGAQAVQIAREEDLDLVMLDVRMPMMTGYDTAKILGKEQPHLPVIFVSAKGMRREVDMAYESGPMVIDYLIKPITLDELVNRVEHTIEARQTQGLQALRTHNMARELVTEW